MGYTISVRDSNLSLIADMSAGILKLELVEQANGLGGWVLTTPSNHPSLPDLMTLGNGIVVRDENNNVIFNGPVLPAEGMAHQTVKAESSVELDGVTEIHGISDAGVMFHRVVQPPNVSYAETGSGDAGIVVAALLDRHIAQRARLGRRFENFFVVPQTIGLEVDFAIRWRNLGEAVQEILKHDAVVVARWEGGRDGGKVEVRVVAPTIKTIPTSLASGALQSRSTASRTAKATVAYTLGQGQGADRQLSVVDVSDGNPYGRVEQVFDKRDVALGDNVGLDLAGISKLDIGAVTETLVFSDTVDLPNIGDSLIVDGRTLPVVEKKTIITPAGVDVNITLGDVEPTGVSRLLKLLADKGIDFASTELDPSVHESLTRTQADVERLLARDTTFYIHENYYFSLLPTGEWVTPNHPTDGIDTTGSRHTNKAVAYEGTAGTPTLTWDHLGTWVPPGREVVGMTIVGRTNSGEVTDLDVRLYKREPSILSNPEGFVEGINTDAGFDNTSLLTSTFANPYGYSSHSGGMGAIHKRDFIIPAARATFTNGGWLTLLIKPVGTLTAERFFRGQTIYHLK